MLLFTYFLKKYPNSLKLHTENKFNVLSFFPSNQCHLSLQLMDSGDLGDNGVHAVLHVELDTELIGVNVSNQVHRMVVKCAKEQIWRKMNVVKNHVQVRSIN